MDINVQAYRIVRDVTSEDPPEKQLRKAASKRGGLIGGKVRAMKLSPERRSEIAKAANEARWSKAANVA